MPCCSESAFIVRSLSVAFDERSELRDKTLVTESFLSINVHLNSGLAAHASPVHGTTKESFFSGFIFEAQFSEQLEKRIRKI